MIRHSHAEGSRPLTSTVGVSVVARCTLVTLPARVVGKANTLATRSANAAGPVTGARCRKRRVAFVSYTVRHCLFLLRVKIINHASVQESRVIREATQS